ncbi:hypothetical protein F1D61_05185 [Methylobacterium aquaticum]|nr:hypothetical protein F1D61_05185 [Methylobacterium aquaticum]
MDVGHAERADVPGVPGLDFEAVVRRCQAGDEAERLDRQPSVGAPIDRPQAEAVVFRHHPIRIRLRRGGDRVQGDDLLDIAAPAQPLEELLHNDEGRDRPVALSASRRPGSWHEQAEPLAMRGLSRVSMIVRRR